MPRQAKPYASGMTDSPCVIGLAEGENEGDGTPHLHTTNCFDGAPEPEEYEFVKHAGSGKVHVLITDRSGEPVPFSQVSDEMAIGLAIGALLVRCGKWIIQHRGGHERGAYRVDAFLDEDLCRGCYRAVPEAHRHRLFEHPQVGDGEVDD